MRTLRAWMIRLANLFRRQQLDRELAEEIESHLALHIEDNMRAGMSPEEARRNALIMLGGMEKTVEEHRDRHGFRWLTELRRDCRYSLQSILKAPGLSLLILASLGLGIGANTAIYSVIHQLLLSSLAVERPEEIALVTTAGVPKNGHTSTNLSGNIDFLFSYPALRDLERQQRRDVAEFAGFRYSTANISYSSKTISGSILLVSGGYFPLLGVRPHLGRTLLPADDQGAGNPVAMLGYNFWQNNLGGQPAVINRSIRIGGKVFTIVGIAPRGFHGTSWSTPEVIIPLATRNILPLEEIPPMTEGKYWIYLVARLNPAITREQASARYAGVYASILDRQLRADRTLNPEERSAARKGHLVFMDGSRGYSGAQKGIQAPLHLLMGSTGLVLLIAIANAANLLLVHSAARRKELAVCAAVGANCSQIVRKTMLQSLALALAGGIVGLVISFLSLHLLISQTDARTYILTARPEWPVLAYGLGLSLLTGLVFGLFPGLEAARVSPAEALNQESRHSSEARSTARMRKALVCLQVTLAAILLIPTGLLLRSLQNLMHMNLGFRTENVVTFHLSPHANGYSPNQSRSLFERAEKMLAAIPGVSGVASSYVPLIGDSTTGSMLKIEGYTGTMETPVMMNEISPGFFRQMGIPLLMGREFTEQDKTADAFVAIVNEQFVQRFFAGKNPIGRKFIPALGADAIPNTEIVGVVKDSHYSTVRQEKQPEVFYTPWHQDKRISSMAFYLRSSLPASQVISQVRRRISALDPGLPLHGLRTMEEEVRHALYEELMISQFAGFFTLLATILAMIGLYGVMAYTVACRTREIAIRMAVGADSVSIRRMVLKDMLKILSVGLALGIPAALALAKVAESMMFGVNAFNAAVVAGSIAALALAAFVASYLPAWRASRIDPLSALR